LSVGGFKGVLLERGLSYTIIVHNDPLENYQQTLGGVLLSHPHKSTLFDYEITLVYRIKALQRRQSPLESIFLKHEIELHWHRKRMLSLNSRWVITVDVDTG
jgi:hypothetical protein